MAAFDIFLEFVLSFVVVVVDSFESVAECSVSSITSSADLVVLVWCVDNWLATIQSFVAVVTLMSSMDKFSSDNNWSSTSGMLFETLAPESNELLVFRCGFEFKIGNLLANVERLWTDERLDVSASSLCVRYERSTHALDLSAPFISYIHENIAMNGNFCVIDLNAFLLTVSRYSILLLSNT